MNRICAFGLFSFIFLYGCATFQAGGEIQLGRGALLTGKPDIALAHFQRAAQADPNYLMDFSPLRQAVWTYVGRSYYAMGKLPEAHQALEQALSRHPYDFMAKLYLGLTFIRQHGDQKIENPFSLNDIVYALREGISPARVATLVKQRGTSFEWTKDGEETLRMAGADDQLIEQMKKIRFEYSTRMEKDRPLREQGLREVEVAMREIHNWLDYISENTSYGRFWDPGREIRSQVQTDLAMISGGSIDRQKLIASGEWLGHKMEEEIDLARRQEQREPTIRRR
jgi:tetratricopeptide (TPR) repeat protein